MVLIIKSVKNKLNDQKPHTDKNAKVICKYRDERCHMQTYNYMMWNGKMCSGKLRFLEMAQGFLNTEPNLAWQLDQLLF